MSVDVGDVIGKTLRASQRIPLYRGSDFTRAYAYVDPGGIVGVVDTWLDANPSLGRNTLYWGFLDSQGKPYYSPHQSGYYDWSYLQEQGVKTTEEKIKAEELKNLPWYERLIRQYGPWILGTVVVASFIKGPLSGSSKQ